MTKEDVLDTLYLLQNTIAMFKEPLTNDQVIKLVGDIAKCVAKISDDSEEETTQTTFKWISCKKLPLLLDNGLSVGVLVRTNEGRTICGYYHKGNNVWYKAGTAEVIKNPVYWLEMTTK